MLLNLSKKRVQIKSFLCVLFISISSLTFAQYPTSNQLISDVKAKDPKAFVNVTPEGDWKMIHDKVPDWQQPDACSHVVNISGNKKPDGTYWTYKGFAIYNKVGSKMVFDRVFLAEDETRLNGIKLPDDSFFTRTFIEKLNAHDQVLLQSNPGIEDATNFYSIELKTAPRATGNSDQIIVFATISMVYDTYNGQGYKLSKMKAEIELRFEKVGADLVYKLGHRKGDAQVIESIDYGSKDILSTIPTFVESGASVAEWTRANPTYPEPSGSNGVNYPKDQELIPIMEETFLTKEDNFILLFGAKGPEMITDVKFIMKDGEIAQKDGTNKMRKNYYVNYTFFDAKDAEKKLTEYLGRLVVEVQLTKIDSKWTIEGAKIITGTEYLKKTSLSYSSYINTMRAKCYKNAVFN